MYDIKQFRPALYLLLLLGLTGFSLAVEAPGLWILAVAAVAAHIFLTHANRFRPLPRLVANVITILALLYTFYAMRTSPTPIITIGQFLVLLQLIKLFELRANRDYAQLLILSLLLMVAGAISTPSLLFGILFIIYLFISLYSCLLFHLKIENDHALAAQTLPQDKLNQATLKQDQRFLPRSMKKLAALVSSAAVFMAVVVFLFFPRGTGAGMFGQLQFRPSQTLTGFSDTVSFGDVNRIQQNTEIVAQVQVWKNERLLEGTQPLYLRGKTFSQYNKAQNKWLPTPSNPRTEFASGGSMITLSYARDTEGGDVWRQKVTLKPTGTRTLFSLPGPWRFIPARDMAKIQFHDEDDTITSTEAITQRIEYEVFCRDITIRPNPFDVFVERLIHGAPIPTAEDNKDTSISPAIANYARRPEVSGTDPQGRPLLSIRPRNVPLHDLDAQIASNIEKHLRTTFGYTLDLTDVKKKAGEDPIEQFLFDWKKGHCEYFASAMVLLCQSQGLRARMVTGFKCDEFDNNLGKYFIVRQSHAHAWVEVETPNGWKTYDPTSGNDLDATRKTTAWQSIKHFFNWLEFKWADSVVAYDADRRDNLITAVDKSVVNSVVNSKVRPRMLLRKLREWWDGVTSSLDSWLEGSGWIISARLLVGVIALLVVVALYGLFSILNRRWKMRRRALRIGLDNLPTAEQIRLARQLGFYERLNTLLEKLNIVRPRHLTPAEFSNSLTFLPSEAYDTIKHLTQVFYSIRFGRNDLPPDQRRKLEATVHDLEPILNNTLPLR